MADWYASSAWTFRDTEHVVVTAELDQNKLVVQVEEKLTLDQWKGEFDSKHIEELTHKTGNYKQFPVFLTMLESAINKSSESVSLDLLTFSDLQLLRKSKMADVSQGSRGRLSSAPNLVDKNINTKRYLILTYSAEFDRIHYPLALPYVGSPDPSTLKDTIRRLQKELSETHSSQRCSHSYSQLKREYHDLLQEKEDLQEAYDTLQIEVADLKNTPYSSRDMRMLQKLTQKLEEDLLRERTKHQRLLAKKNETIQQLSEELDDAKASERVLAAQLKILTSELTVLKRGNWGWSPSLTTGIKAAEDRRSKDGRRGGGEKLYQFSVRRSITSVEKENRRHGQRSASKRSRTPSPAPRFDPSAYVRSRREKQEEINNKLKRRSIPRATLGHPPRSRSTSRERQKTFLPCSSPKLAHSRSSSVDSQHSRTSRYSSAGSTSSRGTVLHMLNGSSHDKKNRSSSQTRKSANRKYNRKPHVETSTPNVVRTKSMSRHNDSSLLNQSIGMDDIDARLTALQHFMKKSLDNAHHKRTNTNR